ncbi:phosphate acyltransferase PlsX [Rhodobacteraceae bacterium KMS-5]|uniref:Phosphate acyltransferase n=1 Tax=Tabrizicola oligotrophica TaxID=2710650 RepID=A0A6M0QRR9_9RHOB|nr:phosphate acyltransferase PlsX [Tabrizicola oligotrophica]NEY89132.1 phosphate acyltransferase PlsX [Tabrizicola oligotrophica]
MASGTEIPAETVAGRKGALSTVISIDAMGGDRGPAAVVAGLVLSAAELPDARFILHGDQAVLSPLLARAPTLAGRVDLRHAERVVTMEDKPSQVMRHGQGTSMFSTIDAVKNGEAPVAVSCGNTGALMAVAMLRLRKLPGVNRPAIACYWPSRNPSGLNVMLDVGADIKAEAADLLQFAAMGTSYARNSLGLARPRVGLLNVGTEEHKGRAELHQAYAQMSAAASAGEFDFVGFVEGSDIPSDRVDVIVTDGFTGNVALKTGEGTAKLISGFLREALGSTLLARLGALLAMGALKRLQARADPRRANGGVFLGLNGTVIKSHGSADATGIAAAVRLAHQLARADLANRIAARVASTGLAGQDAAATGAEAGTAE